MYSNNTNTVGAGLSSSSGLPTFRGAGGLWNNYDAMSLATPDAFHNDPSLVWQFYSYRRHAALKAKPNKGHHALAELARRRPSTFLTLTQNVDGLSARANHPEESLLCLHGDLFTVKCTSFMCSYKQDRVFDDPLTPALKVTDDDELPSTSDNLNSSDNESSTGFTTTDVDDSSYSSSSSFSIPNGYNFSTSSKKKKTDSGSGNKDSSSSKKAPKKKKVIKNIPLDSLPKCPSCKVGLLRPGVVWFGEALPFNVLKKADDFITDPNEPPVDLILVIGTSGTVWPAAGYVEQVVLRGGKVAVFNIDVESEESIATDLLKNGPSKGKKRKSDTNDQADNMPQGWAFKGDAAELLPIALEPIIGQLRPPRKY